MQMKWALDSSVDAGFHVQIGAIGRPPIVILTGDLDVRHLIPTVLAKRAFVFANTVAEANELAGAVGADTLVCSLLLSHTDTRAACLDTIVSLAAHYKLILFVEPSNHERDYLARHHLKSFHAGISNNRSMDVLAVDLFLEHPDFAEVEHFGWNVAHDDSAAWLVPLDTPADTFQSGMSRRPTVAFNRFVFEFSCFVCRRYDAPSLNLARDLVPISVYRKRSAFWLSGARSGISCSLDAVGREIYRSPSDTGYAPNAATDGGEGVAASGMPETATEQAWVQARPGTPFDLRMSILPDCIVSGCGAVLTTSGVLDESRYMVGFLLGEHAIRNGMTRRHAIGHVEGLSIVALNVATSNYYHWLA